MSQSKVFFLNPHHQPFVEGQSHMLGSIERAHYARKYYMGLPTLFALLICVGWIGYLLFGSWTESQLAQRLDAAGVMTQARVVELHNDGRGLQPYQVVYNFDYSGPGGTTATTTGQQPISQTDYELLKPGDSIPVRYLPDDPMVSRIVGRAAVPLWFYFPLLLVPVLSGYVFSWYRSLEHWKRLQHLEKEGRLLDGLVVSCSKGIRLPKDRRQVWLEYRFRSPEGRVLNDRAEGGMEEHDPLPAPGTAVKVLYVNDELYRVM